MLFSKSVLLWKVSFLALLGKLALPGSGPIWARVDVLLNNIAMRIWPGNATTRGAKRVEAGTRQAAEPRSSLACVEQP